MKICTYSKNKYLHFSVELEHNLLQRYFVEKPFFEIEYTPKSCVQQNYR